MKKLTKNKKNIYNKFDINKIYDLSEAFNIIKKITLYSSKFNTSIDVSINLGIDPKQINQMIRGGVANLPHGTGKKIRILAIVPVDKENEAKIFGADYFGSDIFFDKIKNGWLDFDVIVTTPIMMIQIGKLGKILGPIGLMPNPKYGNVTLEIGKAIKEIKSGKINLKTDRYGIIHTSIGKSDFTEKQLIENFVELINRLLDLKPPTSKGIYLKSIYISGTMSPSIKINTKSINV
jgi:large subunit ribosomal protein L1